MRCFGFNRLYLPALILTIPTCEAPHSSHLTPHASPRSPNQLTNYPLTNYCKDDVTWFSPSLNSLRIIPVPGA